MTTKGNVMSENEKEGQVTLLICGVVTVFAILVLGLIFWAL